ncbi:hypothetical protein BDQ17DRAFT_1373658 [Cyathus striatus]|nr:hypothetical protein BDQ17DRAFT_1373658 [Cyathus striatus]
MELAFKLEITPKSRRSNLHFVVLTLQLTNPETSTTLYVSSLKPNVGHSESSSGVIGVIKATIMIKHKMVVPHIGITTRLNPRLGDLGSQGIVIPTSLHSLLPAPGCDLREQLRCTRYG